MQHQISVITLGISDRTRTLAFYEEGFGWMPVFKNDDIVFFQMNGLMLGLWDKGALEDDAKCGARPAAGAVSLGHNVESKQAVDALMARLAGAGGTVLRDADAPPHGGYRGCVSDPDGHIWEIAWNPAWPIDADGHVSFGV